MGISATVLIFTPERSLGGGVAEFSEVLKRHLGCGIDAEWFVAGQRPGPVGRAFRIVVPFYDAFRLAGLLARRRHDVYHLNPSFLPRSILRDGLFLVVLKLFSRRRTLVFFRGWDNEYSNRIASSGLRRWMFQWTYGRAARILVLGTRFKTDLESLGIQPGKVHTATTMFEGELFRHARRNHADGRIRIVFLARFVASKGIYELLEAFRRVSRDHPELSLVMAGHGEEDQRTRDWCARNHLEDRVDFPGYIGGDQKVQLLVDSDIFVLPTYHGEGCPNALLEAMAAGLPIIVTAVGGIPDVVKDGVNGLVVLPRSPESLEAALRRLIGDPELRATIGRRNRETAWQDYEAETVTRRLEAHYRSLAATD